MLDYKKNILVTGSPGFIGTNLVIRLLKETDGVTIVSFDNMNEYYDPGLKEYRLGIIENEAIKSPAKHLFIKGSLSDKELLRDIFEQFHFGVVVNFAAQAGVRGSITQPDTYIESNIVGFYNILEACRYNPIDHLVYASSSSVYGGNEKMPFAITDKVDTPVSLYAATKKSDELLAYAYSKLYGIPCTGLRFFTVYGPAGRPDMFYYSTALKMAASETIRVFNHGDMERDFTYIDDIIEGVYRVIKSGAPNASPPYAIYNIGGGTPEKLLDFIRILQEELIRAGAINKGYDFREHLDLVGMQAGDVRATWADTSPLERDYGFIPKTGIRKGLKAFAEWFAEYYGTNHSRNCLGNDCQPTHD